MVIDSNIIIRFVVRDNEGQYIKASNFIKKVEQKEEKAEISVLVLDEVIFILQNYYNLERHDFIPRLLELFSIPGVIFIETKKENIFEILKKMTGNKIDFTDLYLMAIANGKQIFSFDKDFKTLKI